VLKLARYSTATQRLLRAFRDTRAELIVFDGMWWAVTTLTTVNYGDIYPITVGGKLFTALVLFCGVALIAVPTGLVSSALTKLHEQPDGESDGARDEHGNRATRDDL
jgi:hypothetical protein